MNQYDQFSQSHYFAPDTDLLMKGLLAKDDQYQQSVDNIQKLVDAEYNIPAIVPGDIQYKKQKINELQNNVNSVLGQGKPLTDPVVNSQIHSYIQGFANDPNIHNIIARTGNIIANQKETQELSKSGKNSQAYNESFNNQLNSIWKDPSSYERSDFTKYQTILPHSDYEDAVSKVAEQLKDSNIYKKNKATGNYDLNLHYDNNNGIFYDTQGVNKTRYLQGIIGKFTDNQNHELKQEMLNESGLHNVTPESISNTNPAYINYLVNRFAKTATSLEHFTSNIHNIPDWQSGDGNTNILPSFDPTLERTLSDKTESQDQTPANLLLNTPLNGIDGTKLSSDKPGTKKSNIPGLDSALSNKGNFQDFVPPVRGNTTSSPISNATVENYRKNSVGTDNLSPQDLYNTLVKTKQNSLDQIQTGFGLGRDFKTGGENNMGTYLEGQVNSGLLQAWDENGNKITNLSGKQLTPVNILPYNPKIQGQVGTNQKEPVLQAQFVDADGNTKLVNIAMPIDTKPFWGISNKLREVQDNLKVGTIRVNSNGEEDPNGAAFIKSTLNNSNSDHPHLDQSVIIPDHIYTKEETGDWLKSQGKTENDIKNGELKVGKITYHFTDNNEIMSVPDGSILPPSTFDQEAYKSFKHTFSPFLKSKPKKSDSNNGNN